MKKWGHRGADISVKTHVSSWLSISGNETKNLFRPQIQPKPKQKVWKKAYF